MLQGPRANSEQQTCSYEAQKDGAGSWGQSAVGSRQSAVGSEQWTIGGGGWAVGSGVRGGGCNMYCIVLR